MSYKQVVKECQFEVSDLVLGALEHNSIYVLAGVIGVDERTIRRWRDGVGEPKYSHYRMLRRFVDSEGEFDDLLSDFFYTAFYARARFI